MRSLILILLFMSVQSMATFVAVLETISIDDAITVSESRFLTDELRSQAGEALPAHMNYTIMTRENINVMLPPGKSVEECEGSCIAETGKNISADYVAQARVGKFGNNLTLTIELYETATGNLLGSFTAMQSNAVDLWKSIKNDAKSLFGRIQDATRNLGNFGKDESGWDQSPFQKNNAVMKPAETEKTKEADKSKAKRFIEDRRDGKKYRVVIIGKKAWMAENLKFDDRRSECYNSDYDNCDMYGRYYTWSQALAIDGNCDIKKCSLRPGNMRGICPEGWHIPTLQEWENLVVYVERKARDNAGSVLKSTYAWNYRQGTNESKFNVLPAGYRFQSGNFMGLGKVARFWTWNELNGYEATSVELQDRSTRAFLKRDEYKANELNVRCVSDE